LPLLIRIDIIPGGFLEGSHEIARAIITNNGDNLNRPAEGDYDVQLMRLDGGNVKTQRGNARGVTRHENVWHFLQDLLELADVL
jgi:hypothetical protein